jgi:hypothetical protein
LLNAVGQRMEKKISSKVQRFKDKKTVLGEFSEHRFSLIIFVVLVVLVVFIIVFVVA